MSETEQDEGRGLRLMMTLLIIALVAAAILVVIDYRLKAQIVAEAAKLREAGFGQQPPAARGHTPAPRGPVSPPQPRVPPVDAMADGAGPSQDDAPHEAPPIVKPGDESARPPRRGSFNVPGAGDGM